MNCPRVLPFTILRVAEWRFFGVLCLSSQILHLNVAKTFSARKGPGREEWHIWGQEREIDQRGSKSSRSENGRGAYADGSLHNCKSKATKLGESKGSQEAHGSCIDGQSEPILYLKLKQAVI